MPNQAEKPSTCFDENASQLGSRIAALHIEGSTLARVTAMGLLVAGTAVQAATITVDNPGNGLTGGDGCSLSEAIVNANYDAATFPDCVAGSGADTIELPVAGNIYAAGPNTWDGAAGFPTVSSTVTIDGQGSTISGGYGVNVLFNYGNLTLNDVTVTEGYSTYYAGGITNQGTLTMNRSTVTNNTSYYSDGGIANDSGAYLNNTTISGNTSIYGAGGIGGSGALTLDHVTITNNSSFFGYGGGIDGNSIAMTNSLVTGNLNDCSTSVTGISSGSFDSDGTCATYLGAGTTTDADSANLGDLALNGGLTTNHALCTGAGLPEAGCTGPNPAVDAIANADCTLSEDQRGLSRPSPAGGACDSGAFEVQQDSSGGVCGDGTVDETEDCDGGGETDTCDDDCTFAQCGDQTVNQSAGETCDDGNTTDGDGCSSTCQTEEPDPVCGNEEVEAGETCDDGNTTDGDGCSSTCQVEISEPVCGNGQVEPGEACDDGNTTDGDGCSTTCEIEAVCGDGEVNSDAEQCDDGNDNNADFCSNTCEAQRAETRLELNPMLVNGTRTYLKFIARLFDYAGAKLGAGHEIRFYTWDGTFLCSDETDAQGTAFCNPALHSQVLSYGRLRYRAEYVGSETYKPSTDTAPAVETLGTGVRR